MRRRRALAFNPLIPPFPHPRAAAGPPALKPPAPPAEPPPPLSKARLRKLVALCRNLADSPQCHGALDEVLWLSRLGGLLVAACPESFRLVRAHFKTLGAFVHAHAGQFPSLPAQRTESTGAVGGKPPTAAKAAPAAKAAAADAAAKAPPASAGYADPDLAFLAGRSPEPLLPAGPASAPPHCGVVRAVAAAGAAGIDLPRLKEALDLSLGLSNTVKTLRLTAYLARFPHDFRLSHGAAGEVLRVHWLAAAAEEICEQGESLPLPARAAAPRIAGDGGCGGSSPGGGGGGGGGCAELHAHLER